MKLIKECSRSFMVKLEGGQQNRVYKSGDHLNIIGFRLNTLLKQVLNEGLY